MNLWTAKERERPRTTSAGVCGLLLLLGTGCTPIIRQAVAQDMNVNAHEMSGLVNAAGADEESIRVCPDDKVQHEDCRVTPCIVTCEDPEAPAH